MEIKSRAAVVDANGDKVGNVSRVVLDPKSDEITHLIVEKGFLFTTDKVIPVDYVREEREDELILAQDTPDFSEFADFEETTFIPLYEQDKEAGELISGTPELTPTPVFWYPPVGYAGGLGPGMYVPYRTETERNIPEGTIVLEQGVEVVDENGEKVGKVGRLFADEESGRLTHFVLERGGLLDRRSVVIPTHWIDTIDDEAVHLAAPERMLAVLPEYTP